MVFPNTILVSLRLASVPLRMSVYPMVMNGISKYHSGIIETGKCTIKDVSGTEWYSIVMNGISKYRSGIIETGKFTIEGLNGTEWYSMVFPNTIQGTIETDQYTIEGLNGTEWY